MTNEKQTARFFSIRGNISSFRRALARTTALAGVVFLTAQTPAVASTIVINSPTTSTVNLSNGDDLHVTSTGSINPTTFGQGVLVNAGSTGGTITNDGFINGNVFESIVVANTSSLTGAINNNGTIQHGITVGNNADITGGIFNSSTGIIRNVTRLNNFGFISGGIHNAGLMSAPTQAGIVINGNSNIAGGLDNSGTIYAFSNALAIGNSSDISGGISNSGTIRAQQGLAVTIGSAVSSSLVNSGTISEASTTRGSAAINIAGAGDIAGGLDNGGTISGWKGLMVWLGGKVSGGITNEATGTIRGTGYYAMLLSPSDVTPININGGHIIGAVIDNNPSLGYTPVTIGGDFTSEGDFSVSSIAVTPGHTFTVGTGHTIAENTLTFGVDSASSFGKLSVSNGAIDLTNVTVTANVGAGATLAGGEELKVGDGTAPIIGGPGGTKTAIQDNSFLWDFKMADGTAASTPTDNTDLYLFVSQAATLGGGHGKALDVLQSLGGQAGTVVQNALDKVNAAATRQSVNHLLDSVLPGANAAPQMAAADFSNRTLNLAGDRIASLTAQDAPQLLQGYAESNAGLSSFGIGTAHLADHTFVGIDLTYGQGLDETSDPNATQNGHSNYQVTLYGNNDLGEGRYIRGMAAYASSSTEIARHNVGGDGGPTATGNFDADQYLARVEAGQSFDAGRATLTPSLLLDWMHYDPQSYKEKGAGDANLNVGQKSFDTMGLGFGVSTTWSYDMGGAKLMPALSGGYKRDLMGDSISATSTFAAGGPSFTSETTPGRDHLNFGASLTYALPANWDMKLGYTADLSRDYQSQAGTLRASLKF